MTNIDNQFNYQAADRKPVRRKWWASAATAFTLCMIFGLFVRYQLSQTNQQSLEIRSFIQKVSGEAMAKRDQSQQSLEVRFYTQNIRYDAKNLDKGEQPWSERKNQLIRSIDVNAGTAEQPIVVGLQEALYNQLEDVLAGLNHQDSGKWSYFGKGRDDGEHGGEFSPVLYQPRQWEVKDQHVYWLSPTPDRPSKGWDAALNRVVTVVTLTSKIASSVTIKVLVTHFDHKGEEARRQAASFISGIMNNSTEPAFLLGDLNTEPKDDPYKILTEAGLKDSNKLVQNDGFGEKYTFTGFDHANEANTLIDYIWAPHQAIYGASGDGSEVKNRANVELQRFGILANYYQGQYFSDHRPVLADYRISFNGSPNN